MYIITFFDGKIFKGGDLQDTKWKEVPDYPILNIVMPVFGKIIRLENYEMYFFALNKVNLPFNRGCIFRKILLMGRTKNKSHIAIVDLIKKRINIEIVDADKEWNERPISGWKQGLPNLIPALKII
jgi:hypothetical protein